MDYRLETCMVESIELVYLILLRSELETIAGEGKCIQTFLYKQELTKDQTQSISCASIPVSSCHVLACSVLGWKMRGEVRKRQCRAFSGSVSKA